MSRYSFPAADPDLLGTFYPELIGCMLDMQDVDDDYIDGGRTPSASGVFTLPMVVTAESLADGTLPSTSLRTSLCGIH